MNIKALALILVCSLGLTSCSNDEKSGVSKPQITIEKQTIVKEAKLHQQLPDNTLAYFRVPNPWFLFSGQENGFEYAQSNKQHNQQFEALRQGFMRNIVTAFEPSVQPPLRFLFEHLSAPLELAIIEERPGQVMPIMVMATQLNFASTDEFKELFAKLVQDVPVIQEIAAINQSGIGVLNINGLNLRYHFDSASGDFRMIFGMFDVSKLEKAESQLQANGQHPMLAMQQQIDSSGLGLFAWLNGKDLMPSINMMLPPELSNSLKNLNLEQLNALAFGYGTAAEKSRLKVILDMPHVGLREFLPAVNNSVELKTVGKPSSFAMLSIPTHDQWVKIIERVKDDREQAKRLLLELDQELINKLDMNFKDLSSILGPELVFFHDQVSSFVAVRLNDKTKLLKLINQLTSSGYGSYFARNINGQEVNHLRFMSLFNQGLSEIAPNNPILEALNAMNSNMFWIEQDGYLIFSSVPQPLLERLERGASQDIASWLSTKQGQNTKHSLFAVSGSFEDLSRNAYHTYIEMMLLFSELVDSDMDVFELPTADKLGFSETGALGFQIDSTENQLVLELVLEQSPLDLFHAGGGMESIAVIGILAAVAIPAYQDYVERTKTVTPISETMIIEEVIEDGDVMQ